MCLNTWREPEKNCGWESVGILFFSVGNLDEGVNTELWGYEQTKWDSMSVGIKDRCKGVTSLGTSDEVILFWSTDAKAVLPFLTTTVDQLFYPPSSLARLCSWYPRKIIHATETRWYRIEGYLSSKSISHDVLCIQSFKLADSISSSELSITADEFSDANLTRPLRCLLL